MGLTTWKHAPRGKILKSDVTIAKNYLSEAHVRRNSTGWCPPTSIWPRTAPERGIVTKMADWVRFLNDFLELSNYPILQDPRPRRADA